MTGTAGGYAIFVDLDTQAPVSLAAGQARGGWVLQAVTARDATLGRGDDTVVIELPALPSAGPAPTRRPAPEAPPASSRPPAPAPTRAAHVVVPRRPAHTPLDDYRDH
ncbi:hypothetical protein V5F53_20320 [Xanthobacter sp. V4C-4]|uniref:hypothetical protein n=1 Tax=Xanthobacter cornucopiae TaxID=3119924 RepID=UPI003729D068